MLSHIVQGLTWLYLKFTFSRTLTSRLIAVNVSVLLPLVVTISSRTYSPVFLSLSLFLYIARSLYIFIIKIKTLTQLYHLTNTFCALRSSLSLSLIHQPTIFLLYTFLSILCLHTHTRKKRNANKSNLIRALCQFQNRYLSQYIFNCTCST